MGLPEPTAELSDPTANEQVDDMKTGEAEPDNEKGEVNPSFQTDDEAPPSWIYGVRTQTQPNTR